MLPSKTGQQTIKNIVFSLKISLASQVLGTYSHPQCQGFRTFGSARVCAEAYETSWIWNQICRQHRTHLSCCEVNLVCSFGISEKNRVFFNKPHTMVEESPQRHLWYTFLHALRGAKQRKNKLSFGFSLWPRLEVCRCCEIQLRETPTKIVRYYWENAKKTNNLHQNSW